MQPLPPGAVSAADWVRVRREFPDATLFSNVQYSFSVDSKNMVETLVLRVRDPKDLIQVSIEDSASAVPSATPEAPSSISTWISSFGARTPTPGGAGKAKARTPRPTSARSPFHAWQ